MLIAVLGGGILVSNLLAYTQVNLAPRDELAELSEIADQIRGEGPTLMTDDQIYALTAYLLYMNKVIGEADRMDATSLPKVKMPNRDNFLPEFPKLMPQRP